MARYLIFDTETTDLIANELLDIKQQPRIIEFYGALYDDSIERVLDEFETYIDPKQPLQEKIKKITGIKDEDLKGQPTFEVVAEPIRRLIHSADAVVAHNLSFDIAVVEAEFSRIGWKVLWPHRRICTVEATEWINGYRLRLGDLYESLFDERFEGAHRARVDTQALARCFAKMKQLGEV